MAAPLPSTPSGAPQRRERERLRVCIPGRLILLDATFECAIEDISQYGARVIIDAPLAPGESGVLQTQRLDVFFDVAWTERGGAGLQFAEPVSQGMIRSVRWFNDWYGEQFAVELRGVLSDWAADRKG